MALRIALAGNPNCGKTTLFNALTGSNQFVGNWPGVTVEKKEGKLKKHDDVVITDLPGIYSLSPYTLEEVVARNYLIGERPDAILNIIDGTNLERNLYLTTQLTELGIPVVIAINMMDVVKKIGDKINISELSKKLGCKMIYISTDYVFNGQGTEPWQPDCKDYAPQNVYGQSKLDGELAVANTLDKYFIVRIAWVFGVNGKNFIKTMINVGKTHDEVRVVSDQIGTPTYTLDLSRLLVDMAETEKYGYYHATNEGGYISWYDFTVEIYKQAGMSTKVTPVTTAEYGLSKAARPFNSRLDKSKLAENGFTPLPTWQDALSRYLKEIQ